METPTKVNIGPEGGYSPAPRTVSGYSSTSCPPYQGSGGSSSGSQPSSGNDSGKQPDVTDPSSGCNCPCPSNSNDVPQSIQNPDSEQQDNDDNKLKDSFQSDPVDVYSGAHTISVNLMNLFAGQKLSLTAHYNSSRLTKGVMGYGWYHNFERRLEVIGAVSEIRIYESPSRYERYESCNSGSMFVGTLPSKKGYFITLTGDNK